MVAAIALLAFALGLQNAVVRTLAVADLTTTVLTLTLTGLAVDSMSGERTGATLGRRGAAALAMFSGALLGGLLVAAAGRIAPVG